MFCLKVKRCGYEGISLPEVFAVTKPSLLFIIFQGPPHSRTVSGYRESFRTLFTVKCFFHSIPESLFCSFNVFQRSLLPFPFL